MAGPDDGDREIPHRLARVMCRNPFTPQRQRLWQDLYQSGLLPGRITGIHVCAARKGCVYSTCDGNRSGTTIHTTNLTLLSSRPMASSTMPSIRECLDGK